MSSLRDLSYKYEFLHTVNNNESTYGYDHRPHGARPKAFYELSNANEMMEVAEKVHAQSLGHILSAESQHYTPIMFEVAEILSHGLQFKEGDLMKFLYNGTYNLLVAFTFGRSVLTIETSEPDVQSDQFKVENCLAQLSVHSDEVTRNLAEKGLQEIVFARIHDFLEMKGMHHLSDSEKDSYLSKNVDSKLERESGICFDELAEECSAAMLASIDLAASTIGWILIHLAFNSEKQERLFSELCSHTILDDGHITEATVKSLPYLSAVLNECHRLTPTALVDEFIDEDDPDSSILLGTNEEFNPEQWLDPAVENRKGTGEEIMDHPLMKPFAHGTVGSFMAEHQVKTLLAQLIFDWKVFAPPSLTCYKDVETKSVSNQVHPVMPKLKFVRRSF